jgi:hypothetical protein
MSTAGQSLDRGPQPEHRLRASRRLDWRFLLPDGRLAHVGYVGNRDTTLLASLEMFSETVTVLGPQDWTGGHGGGFDVLVLQAPRRELVRRAGRLLRAGGFLYAEIPRLFRERRPASVLHPTSYARAATQGGFTDVELHWHWPGFENCTRVVPLRSGAAFAYLLSRGDGGAAARTKAALGRFLLERGMLGWGIPSVSIVARRP